ncbi:hypothetical protein IT570_10040 [Candidatus Sumerlaeota bacterium]|nr:hypothetical protein [Candidatus Sumerlaeota bacterium]
MLPRRRLNAARPRASLRPEWRVGIGMLLFAGVFFSGFFDTLIIQVLGKQEVDREVRMIVAAVITVFLTLMTLCAVSSRPAREYRLRERPFFEWPLKAMIAFTPIWLVAGIINQWPITYVLGDVFLISVLPIAYFALVRHPLLHPKRVFNWIYGIMIFMALLSSVLVIYHNVLEGYRHKMSVDAAVIPTLYIMLKGSPTWAEVLLVPLFIISAVLTSKRSTWGAMVIVMAMALVLRPGVKRWFRVVMIAAVIGGVYLVVADEKPEWIDHTQTLLTNRLEETRYDLTNERGDLGKSSGGRMGEIFGVYDTYMMRDSPIDWVTGLGLGAIVHARGGRTRHHVHSTPAAFLARTGVIGLTLWLIFIFSVLAFILSHVRRARSEWLRVQAYFALAVWVSGMVFSIKSQAYWGSAGGGLQLAYIYHIVRMIKAESPAPVRTAIGRVRAPRARQELPPRVPAAPTT